MTDEVKDDFSDFGEETEVETKVKTPFTDKKKTKVVNTKKSTEWVFIGNIKRDGTLYEGGSVCPKGKLAEMKELGFVENI